jgi:hypothetical protein
MLLKRTVSNWPVDQTLPLRAQMTDQQAMIH